MLINKKFIYNFSYKWGQELVFFHNQKQGNGEGDGVFSPANKPEQGVKFCSVPIPIGDRDFSPMWGGAGGIKIPSPTTIPKFQY